MKKAKILIVDDVEIVCIHLVEELKENGYEASSALSGKKAIEKARKENFDIVFVDLIMPEMDGVETCWEIKKVNPKTEIILFSAHPTELELKKNAFIKAGGRDEFLRKPLLGGEVLQIVEKLLGVKEALSVPENEKNKNGNTIFSKNG